MSPIQRQIDRIIIRLKHCAALENVRFVREYSADSAETPVRGMLAVVSLAQTSRQKGYIGGFLSSAVKGETYGAQVEIRLYAPSGENGNGLSELVSKLMTALEQADEEKIITDVSASSIEFDADVNAIYRRVELHIEFCLCEEG